MIETKTAPGGRPGAGMRRGGEALASAHIVPRPAENCKPPSHLTPCEAELWAEAEAVKTTDYNRFCALRRELLLEQAARWEVTR